MSEPIVIAIDGPSASGKSTNAKLISAELGFVYVDTGAQRLGIGHKLLEDLIGRCTELGYRHVIAIIGGSDNQASIGLHVRLGFEKTGVQPSVGFKFGRWIDSVIMQRPLGEGDESPPAL